MVGIRYFHAWAERYRGGKKAQGATGSRAKIVFLTVRADQDYVRAALGAGAAGYVLKSELASDLLPCLRHAEIAAPSFRPPSPASPVDNSLSLLGILPVVGDLSKL